MLLYLDNASFSKLDGEPLEIIREFIAPIIALSLKYKYIYMKRNKYIYIRMKISKIYNYELFPFFFNKKYY